MQRELVCDLKVAQEPLKPRPKPRYQECYRVSLPGVEDEDIDTILQHDDEESDVFINIVDKDLDDASGNSESSFD